MAKPKLALIPAAQGTSLYSVLPSSGVGDFDFTRSGSATRINAQGLIETVANGVSRLNYPMIDGVVKGCPSHLLEPQRLQKVQYSEDFSNAAWTTLASGETVVSNSIISPDGTLNADTLEGDGTATNVYVRNDVTLSASVDYTFSIFAKKGTNDFLAISAEGFSGATNTLLNFDLNNSIVTNGTGNIENYGNGWLRCSFTIPISTDGTGRFLIYPAYNGTTRGFPTSSDANGKNIYLWGAQLEQGSFATSYIPNYGTASGVTRSAETANGSGDASTFNDSEGVLMAEISALVNPVISGKNITISDGTASNYITIEYYQDGRVYGTVYDGSAVFTDFAINQYENNKIAIKYSSNGSKLYVNGIGVDFGAKSFAPNTLNTLQLSNATSTGSYFEGNVKQVQYFDTALNDNELETLTSWVSFQDMAEGQLYTIE